MRRIPWGGVYVWTISPGRSSWKFGGSAGPQVPLDLWIWGVLPVKCYRVADVTFGLETVHDYTHRMLKDYAAEDTPELYITTTEDDIAAEYSRTESYFKAPYIESLAVYRELCDALLDRNVLLLHGSAIAVDGLCYIFTAVSGTGKSTHARLWRERFGERSVMVNDDKPLLRFTQEGVTVYGTPWDGKHRLSRNIAVPLKSVALLSRAAENRVEPVDPLTALPVLLQQSFRSEAVERILPLVERLADSVPIYRLFCNMEPEAAVVAWETMHG